MSINQKGSNLKPSKTGNKPNDLYYRLKGMLAKLEGLINNLPESTSVDGNGASITTTDANVDTTILEVEDFVNL